MEPNEFVRRWNEYTARTNSAENMPLMAIQVSDASVSAETRRFLAEAGLPRNWSGPFTFDFDEICNRVSDVFGCYGQGGDWEPDIYKRLNRYIYLAFDGGGNPLCLDSLDQEKVVFLDHEAFTDPELHGSFINTGVSELASCMLIFQEMLEKYWQQKGEEAELYEGTVPAILVEQALSDIHRADPAVEIQGGYWPQLLEDI